MSDTTLIIIIVVLALAFIIAWVRILYEIGNSTFQSDNTRILWLLFVFIMPLLGVILYLLLGRKQRIQV